MRKFLAATISRNPQRELKCSLRYELSEKAHQLGVRYLQNAGHIDQAVQPSF